MTTRRLRAVFIFTALGAAFGLFWLRLAYWQVYKSGFLIGLFQRQSQRVSQLPVKRGRIISQDGFVLADNQPVWQVGFNPKTCPDQAISLVEQYVKSQQTQVAAWLDSLFEDELATQAGRFNLEAIKQATDSAVWQEKLAKLTAKVKDRSTRWVDLKKQSNTFLTSLTPEQRACLSRLPAFQRVYPDPKVSGYLLGFVGKDKDGLDTGYFGLEGYYNQELTGRPGRLVGSYDALGNPLPGRFEFDRLPVPGRDLKLHLIYPLQHLVSQTLAEGVNKYQADSGTVIVVRLDTMGVLAMASWPDYQPGLYRWYNQSVFPNPAVANLYEPGSTFKVIMMALGLETGAVKPDTRCPVCAGPWTTRGATIRTWNDKYQPNASMEEIIVRSDNVGMAFVADQIGLNRLYDFLVKAGFGRKTGIDLQDDQTIPLKPLSQWYPIDVLTAGFGQGISLTPIKLVELVGAIANQGEMISPIVGQSLTDGDKTYPVKPRYRKRLFNPETTKLITQMMIKVVTQGAAKWAKPADLEVAGKTGTAQVASKGSYDPNQTIASFIGFWPPEQPKYLMLVKLDKPKTSPWGSETAAPLFFQIARQINLML